MARAKKSKRAAARTRQTGGKGAGGARPPGDKRPEFDIRSQRRALHFLNLARSPLELAIAPSNRVYEPRDLGPAGLAIHDEVETGPKIQVLDLQNARRLFEARGKLSPLWGFSHLDQIKDLIPAEAFRKLWQFLSSHFSAATYGQWIPGGSVTVGGATMVARHAALLRTGRVLLIEGACSTTSSRTWIWNPYTRTMVTPAPATPGNNLYCAGHSFLSDGRLLVAGGGGESWQYPKNRVWLFDPTTSSWAFTRDLATSVQTMMNAERWYPTCVSLGDDRILIASGDLGHLTCAAPLAGTAMRMEIYNEATGQFSYVTTPADKFFAPTYPGLHLFPPHQVFFAPVGFRNNSETPGGCAANEASSILTFSGLSGSWADTGGQERTKGMSVLLVRQSPPYIQVMVVGGGDATKAETYTKIDLSAPAPAWGPDLPLPNTAAQPDRTRVHPNVVLLPDGTVFVCGGADVSRPCWIYDPETLSWAEMDELTYPRRYHSVALLLPTGEVMATGGQSTAGESEIEIFQPPYLFRGPPPTITSVSPDPIHHGSPFTIQTPNAADIAKVTLVRPMAVTHQTDSEQRVIPLPFSTGGATTLNATAPSPGHPHGLAPKGYYMLFLINSAGVPSEGTFVFLH